MSVTQTYIDLLLPSLIESNYGTLSTTKTEEGLNAYSFSCPFCSKFVHSKKCKKSETASILPLKGVEKFKGYKWYFKCKRGYSPECRGDTSRSITFSVCTITPSGLSIVMTST